jgi:hypothetical protein
MLYTSNSIFSTGIIYFFNSVDDLASSQKCCLWQSSPGDQRKGYFKEINSCSNIFLTVRDDLASSKKCCLWQSSPRGQSRGHGQLSSSGYLKKNISYSNNLQWRMSMKNSKELVFT